MKKYLLLPLILSLSLGSCETEEPIPTYTLSTSVSPTEGGKITVSPQSLNYKEGDVVTLTPEPNEHWVFQKWDGDVSGSSTPLQITMNSNKSVVGVFVKRDYPLTITIEGEGTVEEKIVTNPSGREYPHGTTVELTPKPKEGWVFESWGGDLSGTETPKTIIVDEGKNVVVTFKMIKEDGSFFIHSNGVTCMCPDTQPGDKGFINAVEYEAVDNKILRKRIEEKSDLSRLCTSLVTDLSTDNDQGLFIWGVINNIQSWDVSNVITMKWMFINADFNQSIGLWDVSKVKNMEGMFQNSSFNQDISNWNVMNVENMSWMFSGSDFNKSIVKWCVSKIQSEPQYFSSNSPLTQENKPKWGTCSD